jgi:hypothetical protein
MCDFCVVDCKCGCPDGPSYTYDRTTDYYRCSLCNHHINPWTVNPDAQKRIESKKPDTPRKTKENSKKAAKKSAKNRDPRG